MNGTPVPISRTVVPLLSLPTRNFPNTVRRRPRDRWQFSGVRGGYRWIAPPSPARFLRFFVGQIESIIRTIYLERLGLCFVHIRILYLCLDKKDGDEQNSKLAQTPVPVYRNIVLYNVTSYFRIL